MTNILIRYGELTLKGQNKKLFITKLIRNIKVKLNYFKDKIEYIKDTKSLIISLNDSNQLDKVLGILKNIFGIYSLSVIEVVNNNEEEILAKTLEIAKNLTPGTFKIEVKRVEKSFKIGSQELKILIASNILTHTNHLKVNVKEPDHLINVVLKKMGTQIFIDRIKGLKGLPVGTSGTALSLLSGGIDSPVASFLSMKRGLTVSYIHFMTPPHTSEKALDKVFKLVEKLQKYNTNDFQFFVCDFSDILTELMHIKNESYRITIMRRMFVKIANIICQQNSFNCLLTGESLGQVASQTIESINTINCVSNLPIIRPLITMDKEEIIDISKSIDTYETSILPFDDVCSMYVPKSPVTKPKIFVAENQEEGLLLNELIKHTINNKIKTYVWKDGELVEKEKS
ncbi:thiamine biosynthesis protein ThiI [Spiroplasma corruscae]|uniref:Probable tRNA sulfurtransferase n=1 Tax=Spiroplasma corruscae TaxID=216934 RepID=A0A222EN32_9MOLU|nr:tRNA uracil 4-sulfurtransferase ThiI [Spiroplasma corruscae]ASP27929.1 thiamine biosynthesis protein ThiI [Spiroplasma corruscae]